MELTKATLVAYLSGRGEALSHMKVLLELLRVRPPVVLPGGFVSTGGRGQLTEDELMSHIKYQLATIRNGAI